MRCAHNQPSRGKRAEVLGKAQLEKARDDALTGGGSGYITRGGKLVMSWGDVKQRYDLKSTTKSFGATALGVAILDGKIALGDKVTRHHPAFGTPPASNAATGWIDQITILHLATQPAGFEKPGGYEKLTFAAGTKWAYSDGGPGETSSIPTKWMSEDGRTIHLVFSGDDHFSVRRATFNLRFQSRDHARPSGSPRGPGGSR